MPELTFAKINFRVRDLDAALGFARDVLGAEVISQPKPISFGQMAMVRLGGLVMEIIAPSGPETPLAQLIERRGEGVDSVGFMAPDLPLAVEELEARGARMTGSQGGPEEDMAWMHPKNPLGLSLEVLREGFWTEVVK